MQDDNQAVGISRRTALRTAAGVAVARTGLGAASPVAAQSNPDFGGWFDDVSNFDGTVDARGESRVTIEVGSKANGGAFGFGPAAVRVDPGTTVVWEWNGKGGVHNVVAEDGSFESEMVAEAGHTFERTLDAEGVRKYYCAPHKAMGMKGAVVVGGAGGAAGSGATTESAGAAADPEYGDWFDGVSNFDGTVDETGRSRVTVEVGATANGGAFGFGPAAVQVSPGTTVVWEWNGKGGVHNVVAEDGSFESEMVGDAGHTFEQTFDEPGTYTYYCAPHEGMGMKGAVHVAAGGGSDAQAAGPGEVPLRGGGVTGDELALGGTFLLGMLSPALFGLFLWFTGEGEDDAEVPPRES
jgi:halocyanin-like protein